MGKKSWTEVEWEEEKNGKKRKKKGSQTELEERKNIRKYE